MLGAIYKDKESQRYIRMYSASEETIKSPLTEWQLIKIYTDHNQMNQDFEKLAKEQIQKDEGQLELKIRQTTPNCSRP